MTNENNAISRVLMENFLEDFWLKKSFENVFLVLKNFGKILGNILEIL